MFLFSRLLVVLHVCADMVWIGSILSVAALLTVARSSQPAEQSRKIGSLALQLYNKVAVPGFTVAFLAGLTALAMNFNYYLKETHFMHPKLTFAFVVIVVHHILGARARKLAEHGQIPGSSVNILGGVLVAGMVASAYFALMKPF